MTVKLVTIDLSKPDECDFVNRVVKKYYPKSPYPPDPAALPTSKDIYFRAFSNQTEIGITGLSPKTPHLVESIKSIIFNDHRGQGHGTALSQAIEDECIKRGFGKIMSNIYYFNHAMIAIKLKQGYKIEGYHPDHDAPGYHEYTLGKVLVHKDGIE